jgi:hypothetical protein
MPPIPPIHDTDEKFRITPPTLACIPGSTAWAAKNAGRKLTAMRSSNISGVTSNVPWRSSFPALLMRTSAVPSESVSAAMPILKASMSRIFAFAASSACSFASADPSEVTASSAAANCASAPRFRFSVTRTATQACATSREAATAASLARSALAAASSRTGDYVHRVAHRWRTQSCAPHAFGPPPAHAERTHDLDQKAGVCGRVAMKRLVQFFRYWRRYRLRRRRAAIRRYWQRAKGVSSGRELG